MTDAFTVVIIKQVEFKNEYETSYLSDGVMGKILTFSFLGMLFFSFCLSSPAFSKTYSFATLENFRPFAWTENGKVRGIDVEIIQEMCRRLEIRCEISAYPWKRALLYTKTGVVDGAFAGFKNQEREAYAFFVDVPIHFSKYNIFVKKGSGLTFKGIEDLYGKTLGINRGFKLSTEFDTAARSGKFKLAETNSAGASFRRILLGRLDGVVGNYLEGEYLVNSMGIADQVVPLSPPLIPLKKAYLMISKAAKIPQKLKFIERVEEVLCEMNNDGTVEEITRSYIE